MTLPVPIVPTRQAFDLDAARAEVARAVADSDTERLLELRGQGEAVQLYYRRAGAKEVADDAGEIKVLAERGLGQVDKKQHPHGGDRRSSFRVPGT